jgi:hypothetical protein
MWGKQDNRQELAWAAASERLLIAILKLWQRW